MNISIGAGSSSNSKGIKIASWVLRAALGAAFLAAGTAKLLGVPMMVQTFDAVGMGQWLRYFTGAAEIAGAIGLFVPRLTSLAALGLGLTMVGAVAAHALVLPTSGVPALALGIMAFVVVFIHRQQIKVLFPS